MTPLFDAVQDAWRRAHPPQTLTDADRPALVRLIELTLACRRDPRTARILEAMIERAGPAAIGVEVPLH